MALAGPGLGSKAQVFEYCETDLELVIKDSSLIFSAADVKSYMQVGRCWSCIAAAQIRSMMARAHWRCRIGGCNRLQHGASVGLTVATMRCRWC
jgi:hypothetical protein